MNLNQEQKRKFENCFKKYAKRVFIIDHRGKKITYDAFFKSVLKIIKLLRSIGCKRNSRILILSENSSNYLAFLAACVFGGYVACPVDPTTKSERLENLKKLYKTKTVIKNFNEVKINRITLSKNEHNLLNYNDTECLIIASAGSKGESKGILFLSSSIIKSAESFSKLAGYNKKTVILHCLPMFYMGGILDTFFSPIFSGSTIIVGEKFSISNAKNFWKLPIKNNCNTLFLTPTIVAFITTVYREPGQKILRHLLKYKSIFATGSTLYPEVRDKFYKIFKKKIFSCYGTTEIGGPLAIQGKKNTFKDYCVGYHSKKVKIIARKYKNELKKIFVKTPFFMKGYLTFKGIEKPIDRNGYYDTGDLGDYKNGLIFIKSRHREIIKKGGELISLGLVENAALKVEGVLEAAAIGKKDFFAGEELYLFVVLKNNEVKNKKIVQMNHVFKKKLRPIEIPKKIITISKFNRTLDGKILKDKLVNLL